MKWKIIDAKNLGSVLKDKITEGKFIEVEVLVENKGKKSYFYPYVDLNIYDEKGRVFPIDEEAVIYYFPEEKQCFAKQIKPGFSPIDCINVYEVPKDSKKFRLYIPSTNYLEKGVFVDLGSF